MAAKVITIQLGTQVKNDETKIENKQKKYSGQKTKDQTKYQMYTHSFLYLYFVSYLSGFSMRWEGEVQKLQ